MIKKQTYPNYKIETIGISGKKKTGKKEFAVILQNALEARGVSKPIIKAGFADAIYQTLISLFSPKLTWDNFKNKEEIIPGIALPNGEPANARTLLQHFGAMCMCMSPTVWIDRIFKHRLHDYIYIIYDVRLPNEAAAVMNHKGILIRLDSPVQDEHITETALDDFKGFDIVLECKTRGEMKDDIQEIVKSMNVY
jgi:hypothetical protein